MAEEIGLGVDSNTDCEAVLRCLPPVSALSEQVDDAVPDSGLPYAQLSDLENCAGLLIGSPGNHSHRNNAPSGR